MSKRMISTNDKAEKILQRYKERGLNISGQVSNALINYELPQYNPLYTEGLYLLDSITNGLKDWRGPHGSRINPENDEDASYDAIKRALSWLKNNHIKDPTVIETILSHFETVWGTEGLSMEDIPEHLVKDLNHVQSKLGKDKFGIGIGLGQLGRDMIEDWSLIWDDSETYEALLTIVYFEKLRFPFKPFETLGIMRGLEQTFIYEQIKR